MPGIKDFRDKVVVITGAGSGIGRATAMAFSAEGANVVIADIRGDRLAETAQDIEKLGGKALTREVDVADKSQVEEFARFVIEKYGQVDILYNNAGVGVGGPVEKISLEDWEWIVRVNFWGVIYGVHYFLPYMIERRYGHIVNTASGAGLVALPVLSAYTSTKFAVVGFSEAIRAELRRYGIGVTAICPGIINTNIVEDGRAYLNEESKVKQEDMVEFYRKRGWPPERVARAVLKGVRKNKAVVPVGPETWIGWYIKRLSLTLSNAQMAFMARRSL